MPNTEIENKTEIIYENGKMRSEEDNTEAEARLDKVMPYQISENNVLVQVAKDTEQLTGSNSENIAVQFSSENQNNTSPAISVVQHSTEVKNSQSENTILKSKNLETNFKNHLFWPQPIVSQRKMNKERLPLAISSASYRKFLEDKENRAKEEAERKMKRKQERQLKTLAKKTTQIRKKQRTTHLEASEEYNTQEQFKEKEKCAGCTEDLDSDAEEDDLKNIGCDKCIRWYHLMCTEFVGLTYEDIKNRGFTCFYCT